VSIPASLDGRLSLPVIGAPPTSLADPVPYDGRTPDQLPGDEQRVLVQMPRPALGDLPISRTWYGFRPWAPDSLPVLGPWPGVEGLWVATAHFRSGILLAPITARLMTSWITAGKPGMDVRDFLPDRFVRG